MPAGHRRHYGIPGTRRDGGLRSRDAGRRCRRFTVNAGVETRSAFGHVATTPSHRHRLTNRLASRRPSSGILPKADGPNIGSHCVPPRTVSDRQPTLNRRAMRPVFHTGSPGHRIVFTSGFTAPVPPRQDRGLALESTPSTRALLVLLPLDSFPIFSREIPAENRGKGSNERAAAVAVGHLPRAPASGYNPGLENIPGKDDPAR